LTHDNTGAVIPKFKSIGATEVADPRQPVFALDHNVQDKSAENQAKYAASRILPSSTALTSIRRDAASVIRS